MEKKRVLISILNWNKARETLVCVRSLQSELTDEIAETTVIIVDNGSKIEELAELEFGLQAHNCLLKKLPKNLGFTGGHNVTIKMAIDEDYDFIWLINNDATVAPGALASLLSTMQSNDRCGAASPVIRNADDERLIATCLRTHDWSTRSYTQTVSIPEAERIQCEHPEKIWLVGTAIFFRIAALKEVGLLDERLFAYYDDDDIGARLAAAGWLSLCAFSASVAHEAKKTAEQYPLYFYYLMQRNEMLFWQKNMPRKFRRLLWLKLVDQGVFNVNCFYRRGLQAQGDAALLGVLDFICRRFGAPVLGRNIPFILRVVCAISRLCYQKKTLPTVVSHGN